MQQFFMNHKAITTPKRFRAYFDPRDFLRNREMASGFCMQQFRGLFPILYYHSEVLYIAVFQNPQNSFRFDAEDYCAYTQFLVGLLFNVQESVKRQLAREDARNLRESLWRLAQETGLEPEDRKRLFLILTAGYSIALKTLETCPLTARDAEEAYLRLSPAANARDPWVTFDDSTSDVALAASETPYKILMAAGAKQLLSEGVPITHRKLIALPHAQGDQEVSLTLELYKSPGEPPYRTVRIAVGDYRYFNFVKNIPVHSHPRGVRVNTGSGNASLLREGRELIHTRSHCAPTRIPIRGSLEIYGFALEENGGGFILLTSDGVRYNNYSERNLHFYLPEKDIVEVAFRGTECLLLRRDGHVYTLGGRNSYPAVICLEEILRNLKQGV